MVIIFLITKFILIHFKSSGYKKLFLNPNSAKIRVAIVLIVCDATI
jgi:hypothetical protein